MIQSRSLRTIESGSWRRSLIATFLLATLMLVHVDLHAAESSVGDDISYSAFHSFFEAGIQAGKIKVVEFSVNPDCMSGRKLKSLEERSSLNCGVILRAYHFLPSGKPAAKLLVVHGMQSNSAWFLSGNMLAENGIEILAFDRRGSGMSDGNAGHVDDFKEFFEDMDAATIWLWNPSDKANRDVPLHLHANCFGTRISIPYMQEQMEATTRKYLVSEWEKKQQSLPAADRVPEDLREAYLDDIQGFKFVSVINTSPATHMSEPAEKLFRDNIDCIMQIVQEDKDWIRRQGCFSEIDGKSGTELASYIFDLNLPETWKENRKKFKASEFACLNEYYNKFKVRLRGATGCSDETIAMLKDPTLLSDSERDLSEDQILCIDGLISTNITEVAADKCSDQAFVDLKSSGIDPEGVRKFRSPLTDDLFTNNPEFLSIIERDKSALRELSRRFLYATHDMSTKMNNYLRGRMHNGEVLPSTFGTSVLVFLQTKDLMVENDGIIHEYVGAHKGAPITKKDDLLSLCQKCNPKVYRALSMDATGAITENTAEKTDVRAECAAKKAELLSCPNPQDVLQCEVSVGADDEVHADCGVLETAKLIEEPRIRRRSDTVKRLIELDCDHFMEFCSDQSQTQKYRENMLEWLKMPRWKLDWKDFFEADFFE